MKFIIKSMLILSLLAVAIGAVAYNVMSANAKQSGTINLTPQNLAKESHPVGDDVEQVETNGPFDLVVTQADHASLVIEGEERLLPKVVVRQDGKILRITTKGMLVTVNQTVRLTVAIPKLTALTQSGSGDAEVQGFTGAEINFNLNGSGNLSADGKFQHVIVQAKGSGDAEITSADADQVEVNSSGSGNIVVTGKARLLNALLTGSGDVDAERLITTQAEVTSHGSGNLKVYANKEVRVSATGSGDVQVFGNPAQKAISHSGSGNVE